MPLRTDVGVGMVRIASRLNGLCLLAVTVWGFPNAVWAADITVLSSQSLRTALVELAPRFERASGDRLIITYDTAHNLKVMVEGGQPFDVAILTPALTVALVQQGRVADGSAVTIARTGVGVAVRKGAPRPDIGSAEALKQTLIKANSVAYSTSGASRSVFIATLRRFGIEDEVKTKGKAVPQGLTGELVVRGEADLAVQLMPELMAVPGVDVIGPFPQDVQSYVVLAGGISAGTADRERAKAFLAFLKAPAAAAVIRAKGLDPG